MRNTFINTLCELSEKHDDIFLLCGDLGYSVLEGFAQQFPERFLNVGIAEQNMTQVAAGLALEGFNVFTYSIGNFPTLRCMEQIRYDVCYHEANVKVVAIGAGYAYGPLGVSHHTTEDIAMLRSLPNMTVCAPADPIEAKVVAQFMASYDGPGYVRLNKTGEACVHSTTTSLALSPGKLIEVIGGRDVAVLVNGAILGSVMGDLKQSGVPWAVFSAPFVGRYDVDEINRLGQRFSRIITVEEHQLNGGFGSSIVEAFSDLYADGKIGRMPRIQRIAIPNQFIGVSGSQSYLRRAMGLVLPRDIL